MFPPDDLLYSHRHLWIRPDREAMQASVGITDFLQEHLPEIESLDMPLEGDELEMDVPCVFLHLSTKRIRKVYSPLTGRILQINRDVLDNPNLLHLKPYDSPFFLMEFDELDELDMLMNAERYSLYLDSL